MNWSILSLKDFHFLKDCLLSAGLEGSDTSLVNIFLLQKKYDTKTAIEKGWLFRYYSGAENRRGYGFPLKLCDNKMSEEDKNHSLGEALALIKKDAEENGRKMKFCLLSESQKNIIEECLKKDFPELKFEWQTSLDDCDYIYRRESLAALQGKTYHKKKNHVSRFLRKYEGKWEFRSLNLCSISDDMIYVAGKWLEERFATVEMSGEEKKILSLEHEMIKSALENKEDFALDGGVLYTEGKPVAMTLASKISDSILDVHFEKCLSQAAADGAYAAINWCFASASDSVEFLNREEDMGVEGLRKAKLSYHPDKLLEKYYSC
ncbi:MAG: phosphatidylglycerol lysyltransferase domain-containing protein [Treponema sp.]|nr:phosphatidylglycerol lysyltransferase domain-containing protein [Treponema sp.]